MKNTLNKYGLAITKTEELKEFFCKVEDNQESEGFFHWDKKVYVNVKDNEIGECETSWDLSEFPEEVKILRNIHKTHKILTIMIDSEEWIIFFKNDIFESSKELIKSELKKYTIKLNTMESKYE